MCAQPDLAIRSSELENTKSSPGPSGSLSDEQLPTELAKKEVNAIIAGCRVDFEAQRRCARPRLKLRGLLLEGSNLSTSFEADKMYAKGAKGEQRLFL